MTGNKIKFPLWLTPELSFHIRMLPLHTMQKAAKNGGSSFCILRKLSSKLT